MYIISLYFAKNCQNFLGIDCEPKKKRWAVYMKGFLFFKGNFTPLYPSVQNKPLSYLYIPWHLQGNSLHKLALNDNFLHRK